MSGVHDLAMKNRLRQLILVSRHATQFTRRTTALVRLQPSRWRILSPNRYLAPLSSF